MAIELPDLPYARDALAPHISEETLNYHYGKHHAAYVTKTNAAIEGTDLDSASLEEIIKKAHADGNQGLFNNAAQVWNHTFYWEGLTPGGDDASPALVSALEEAFGSVDAFKDEFTTKAGGNFGSGWTWLVKNSSGKLEIVNTDDADTPLVDGHTPILTCDVWEHAYYLDYQNARPEYLKNFWELVNHAEMEKRLNA